jgi:hypothetical protein
MGKYYKKDNDQNVYAAFKSEAKNTLFKQRN